MIREPQGVAELMAQTEAAWQRQLDACADATAEARTALVADLVALRAEYGDADYPRKAAIEKALRALIRRHDAFGADAAAATQDTHDVAAEAAQGAAGAVAAAAGESGEAPPGRVPLGPETTVRRGHGEASADAPDRPHGPVPLGPETSVRPREADERPAPPHEPHGPVPLGPESAVRSREGHRPAPSPPPPPPRPPGGVARPIPHGAPGPEADAAGAGTTDDGDGATWSDAPGGSGTGAWRRLTGWVARGRLAMRYEGLLRKREARLAEVGVRIRQLEERGAVATAGDDAGVKARLAQVAQVDAEIAKVLARREALGGP